MSFLNITIICLAMGLVYKSFATDKFWWIAAGIAVGIGIAVT